MAPRPRPRRIRRPRWAVGLGLSAVLLGLAGGSAVQALRARDGLETGRTLMIHAEDRLLSGDVAAARSFFAQAREAFAGASRDAAGPLVGMWAVVPLAGRSYDGLRDLAWVGGLTAQAGQDVTAEIGKLPGGLSALTPSAGSIGLDGVRSLEPVVASAADDLRRASGLASGLAGTFVLPQVAEAGDAVRARLADAAKAASTADSVLRALPEFAGANGPRRYFVAVQTPSELRGTGGFIGAFSILTIDDGAVSLAPFRDIATLHDAPIHEIGIPSPDFGALYDAFGGAGFWRNINMSPDAPTVSTAIEALYERVEGVRLDGTIFVDPGALAAMVQATGPIFDPQIGVTLSAGDIVPFMTNEAYARFPYETRRKILGGMAAVVLSRFLQGTDPVEAIRALASATGGGHLVLHASDPGVEQAFRAAEIDGSLGAGDDGGDYLGVFLTNAAGNKVDYYLDEQVSYAVTLGADGAASQEATVRLANGAPAGEPPSEVLGPYGTSGLAAGDTQWWVQAYCAPGCTLASATEDGGPGSVQPLSEHGFPMFRSFVRADAGHTATLGYRLDLPRGWEGDGTGGTYRLTLQAQPTVRPVRAEVTVRVPKGMGVVETSEPMRIDGGLVTWSGPVQGTVTLAIRFERPFLGRVWSRVSDLLGG